MSNTILGRAAWVAGCAVLMGGCLSQTVMTTPSSGGAAVPAPPS